MNDAGLPAFEMKKKTQGTRHCRVAQLGEIAGVKFKSLRIRFPLRATADNYIY